MVESGTFNSLKEIAKREGVDTSYVSRMANLTTLASDIVAAIVDETLPPEVTLFELAVDPPPLWHEQRTRPTDRQRSQRQNKGFGRSVHYPMLNPNS